MKLTNLFWDNDKSDLSLNKEDSNIQLGPDSLSYNIPDSLGRGGFRFVQIRKGITLGIMDQSHSLKLGATVNVPVNYIKFNFIYSSSFQTKSSHKTFPMPNTQFTSSMVIGGVDETMTIELDENYSHKFVSIFMEPKQLLDLMDDYEVFLIEDFIRSIHKSNFDQFIHFASFNPLIQLTINTILQVSDNSPFQKIILESKVLELIAIRLEQLNIIKNTHKKTGQLSHSDTQKIRQAREIIENNLHNPPSILQLSRQIALNDYKLKKGFKDMYDTTIFSFVRKLRMEKARVFLESGEMNITEVSYELGFSSPSHFAAEFKKQYNISPREYLSESRNKLFLSF